MATIHTTSMRAAAAHADRNQAHAANRARSRSLLRAANQLAVAASLLMCGLPPSAFAGSFWQPLCPDGALCATSSPVFAAGGRVLLSPGAASDSPSQWVTVATLLGAPTDMRNVSAVGQSGNYLGAAGSLFSAYDAGGNLLYSRSSTSIEAQIVFESHASSLGPAVYFGATSPPTVFSALAVPGSVPNIYLSRNEGQTSTTQQSNVLMQNGRTSFVAGADGQRVWAIPGPITPGLWQTPSVAGGAALDFSKLARVDDGSFPADVFQVRVVPAGLNAPGGNAVALAADGMYVSTDLGRSWSRAGFTGVVDDVAFPNVNSADTQALAARGSVFLSRDRGQSWSELALGLPADRYSLVTVDGGVVADGAGGIFVCKALDCAGPAFGRQTTSGANLSRVTEFHNTTLDHYFITADEDEKNSIRSGGAGPGWVETGQTFSAWTSTIENESAYVCRFYGDPVRGPNSHFYSASTAECRGLLELQQTIPDTQPRWNIEGYAFKVSLPNAGGACRGGLLPVFRAYNNGFAKGIDSNHRFAPDRSLLTPLLAQGWIDEGIAFCVPAGAQ